MFRRMLGVTAAAAVLALGGAGAAGQTRPWDLLFGRCDVVNARNVQLVVPSTSRQLEVVETGLVVPFGRVDDDGFVLINDVLQGFLSLGTDAEGREAVWWLGLSGGVVELNQLTGEVQSTMFLPSDLTGAVCDACDVVDDPDICGCLDEAECGDGNPCTDDFCERGVCLNEDNTDACNDGDPCTTDDTCARGFCVGDPLDDCDPSDGGNSNDNSSDGNDGGTDGGGSVVRPGLGLCGAGSAAGLNLTLLGLIAAGQARRRRPTECVT